MYITNSFKRIISSPSNEMHKINSISQFKYSRLAPLLFRTKNRTTLHYSIASILDGILGGKIRIKTRNHFDSLLNTERSHLFRNENVENLKRSQICNTIFLSCPIS